MMSRGVGGRVGLLVVVVLVWGFVGVRANQIQKNRRYKLAVYNGVRLDLENPVISREIQFTDQAQQLKMRGFEFQWQRHEDGSCNFTYTAERDGDNQIKGPDGEIWSPGEFGGFTTAVTKVTSPANLVNVYHVTVGPARR